MKRENGECNVGFLFMCYEYDVSVLKVNVFMTVHVLIDL